MFALASEVNKVFQIFENIN